MHCAWETMHAIVLLVSSGERDINGCIHFLHSFVTLNVVLRQEMTKNKNSFGRIFVVCSWTADGTNGGLCTMCVCAACISIEQWGKAMQFFFMTNSGQYWLLACLRRWLQIYLWLRQQTFVVYKMLWCWSNIRRFLYVCNEKNSYSLFIFFFFLFQTDDFVQWDSKYRLTQTIHQ